MLFPAVSLEKFCRVPQRCQLNLTIVILSHWAFTSIYIAYSASYRSVCSSRYHYSSLSSWHTLLERSHAHSWTPVFSRDCLLPCTGRTDVQWSLIWFSGSEPCAVGSSLRSFLLSVGFLFPLVTVLIYVVCCVLTVLCLQCSDTVGWAAGRASGL